MLPDFEVCDLSVIQNPPRVEETGESFLDNATLKAQAISSLTDDWVIADDSGLEVDSLDGAPGVYSSRYGGEEGNDAKNNAKLMREMAGLSQREARFRCVIVVARGGQVEASFSGAVEGRIAEAPSGAGGFGYDPLFIPEGYDESFAELGEEIKNNLSHRAKALQGAQDWLSKVS